MDKLPKRKNIRLKNFDYSQAGYYYVTICTKDKIRLLSKVVEGSLNAIATVELSLIGNEIKKSIEFISKQNTNVVFDKYIIMPNHIHLIAILENKKITDQESQPLHKIIGQLKSYTNKKYNDINKTKNMILWQRNYYEHIIRNEKEYEEIYEYIDTNPLKWEIDKYYMPLL